MKQASFLIFSLTLITSFALADDSKFISIFNGQNLDGWDSRAGAWEVEFDPTETELPAESRGTEGSAKKSENGEIWCTGKDKEKNWLVWREKQPANFILKMEFKWQAGNSGVQVRSDDLGDHQIFGYQVEVARQEVMGLWHHSLLAKDHPRKEERHLMATAGQTVTIAEDGSRTIEQVADAEKLKSLVQENGWNDLEIIAEGNTIVQKINGVVFSKVIDDDVKMSRKKGFIALQDHGKGCVVGFRKIRLKELH